MRKLTGPQYLMGIFFMLISQVSFGQCLQAGGEAYLEANDVKASFFPWGEMFRDHLFTGDQTHQVVYAGDSINSLPSSIGRGSIAFGGYDSLGNLCQGALFINSIGLGFYPGPLDATGIPISCTDYNRIWKIEGDVVRSFIKDYVDNGQIDNPVDRTLLAWPGKGNTNSASINGFALPNQDLAPFVDRNGDGIYDPYDGDYPIADPDYPTVIADEILWSVFNDVIIHGPYSQYNSVGAEVQRTAYAFSCPGDSVISRTIFVRHKIIYKNVKTLYAFKAGIWTNFDIGCHFDDYVGSIPEMNTMYAYNMDNYDESICQSYFSNTQTTTVNSYGFNPPVQAMTVLNDSVETMGCHLTTYATTSLGNREIIVYNVLRGRWHNGAPIIRGRDGYDPGDTISPPVHYIYPDNPNDTSGWSMYQENLSEINFSPLAAVSKDTLFPGETIDLLNSYSYHRRAGHDHLGNVDVMYEEVPLIQDYYEDGYANRTCNHETITTPDTLSLNNNITLHIYPNPATNTLTVTSIDDEIEAVYMSNTLGGVELQHTNINQKIVQLDVSGKAQGLYLLTIQKGGVFHAKKVCLIK